MEIDRAEPTAQGFWRYSANYLLAAREVGAKVGANQRLMFPTLHLYAMVVELALKAFLLKRGESSATLKRLSHNLEAALVLAKRRKLGLVVKLSAVDGAAIRAMNHTYSRHDTRYIRTGLTYVPTVGQLSAAAERLVGGIEEFCTGQKDRI